jgi:hypothetical protein
MYNSGVYPAIKGGNFMLNGKTLTVVILWALSLIIVAEFAQAQRKPRPTPPAPIVLSGNDIGFRVQGDRGDHVVGALVVKIGGEWVPAEPADSVKALSSIAK